MSVRQRAMEWGSASWASRDDYEQILHDVAHAVAPPLGWKPAREQGSLQPDVPAGSVK